MTERHTRLGGFETRLLEDLKTVAAEGTLAGPVAADGTAIAADTADTAAGTAATARRGPGRRRTVYGLAASVAVAASVGIAGPLIFGGEAAQAAPFTVVVQPDGGIRFAIKEFRDPQGLQNKLISLGANVKVDYVPRGMKCADGRYTEAPVPGDLSAIIDWVQPPPDRLLTDEEIAYLRQGWQELRPELIPQGTTLVLTQTIWGDEQKGGSFGGLALAQGPVGPCRLVAGPDGPILREGPLSP